MGRAEWGDIEYVKCEYGELKEVLLGSGVRPQ